MIACFDGDDAGHKAALRALELFLTSGPTRRGIFVPEGLDPDDFIRTHGVDECQALAEQAIPLFGLLPARTAHCEPYVERSPR